MKSRSVREEAVRLVLLLAGLCVAHLGVTLFLQTDLGSDPFNVFVQGLFRFLPWPGFMTHGRVHLLVSLVIMVVLLVVDRKFVRIGTVVCMALGGPIIDVFTVLLAPLIHSERPLPVRLAALVLGCVILAFGMTIVICSEAGTGQTLRPRPGGGGFVLCALRLCAGRRARPGHRDLRLRGRSRRPDIHAGEPAYLRWLCPSICREGLPPER